MLVKTREDGKPICQRQIRPASRNRLLALISEPEFIKFEHLLSEPNFFSIVGRAHYERWHSAFLGWLLDANGLPHLLSDYVLRRFLLLLLDEKCLTSSNHHERFFLETLPLLNFYEVEVTPNEYVTAETSVLGIGRFDIFLNARYVSDFGGSGNLNIIFELKIDTKPQPKQSTKYADWLHESHPTDINLLII